MGCVYCHTVLCELSGGEEMNINLYYVYHVTLGWADDDGDFSRSFHDAREFQSAEDAQDYVETTCSDESRCYVFGWAQ